MQGVVSPDQAARPAEPAEDVTTLMRANFYDEEGAEGVTVPEEELSLSPPSQAVIAALTQLLAFEQVDTWLPAIARSGHENSGLADYTAQLLAFPCLH